MKIENLREPIKNLKLIIFDVDGVFTDGSVYLDKKGNEMLKFSRIDGRGISLIRKRGFKTAVISSEESNIVKVRMRKLNIDEIFIGIDNKLEIYKKLKEKYGLEDKNICYLGYKCTNRCKKDLSI
jgi:YrbI family 3-deoxy-D-manno-octulosonate 8-phosphate phosphatase